MSHKTGYEWIAREQGDALALKNATVRGELLSAEAVAERWSAILHRVQGGVLAAPGRVAGRLPHLTSHDIAEPARQMLLALPKPSAALAAPDKARQAEVDIFDDDIPY